MNALGDDGPQCVACVALLGRRFDWDLLRAVTGLPEGTVLACLRERLTRNCW